MEKIVKKLRDKLVNEGEVIKTSSWQGTDNPPEMVEVLHISELIPMLNDAKELSDVLGAKQPWANVHFKERVQGFPSNPDPSHKMWARTTDNYKMDEAKFSHTYSERLWPSKLYKGIRFNVGDLNSIVNIFRTEPDTRQAYMPMFMHEDLNASLLGERVPCSLGWHFIIRNGKMDCMYPMRSCDAMRHLHNDLYFANKLVMWIIKKAELKDVVPGNLHFIATSLHCFKQDIPLYEKGIIK